LTNDHRQSGIDDAAGEAPERSHRDDVVALCVKTHVGLDADDVVPASVWLESVQPDGAFTQIAHDVDGAALVPTLSSSSR
jgi:hypothetical protein